MAELARVRERGIHLIEAHLGTGNWQFTFDSAKRRFGLCNYTTRRISISKHLAAKYPLAEVEQVLLHEIAHALAGKPAGHGPVWLNTARALGYTGGRLHPTAHVNELANYLGTCPAGHEHYRHRAPAGQYTCRICHQQAATPAIITWRHRVTK